MKVGRKLMTMAHNFISIRRRENLFEQDQDTWGLKVELKKTLRNVILCTTEYPINNI